MRRIATRKEILAFPKVELHRHVDGAVNPDLVWFLARKEGLKLPCKTRRGLARFLRIHSRMSVEELLGVFGLVIACMQKQENIELVFYEQMLDLAAENIVYAELRFAPQYHTRGGLSLGAVIEAALRGVERGSRDTKESKNLSWVEARLIVSIARECDPKKSEEVVEAALKFQDKGVCGIDLACNEAVYPPELHRKAYALTFNSDLKRTVHAGEFGDQRLKNIQTSLLKLRADRLGHAIGIHESPELLSFCVDRGIGIEACPISNVICGNIPSIQALELEKFREEEIFFSINSDDPALFGVSLSETLYRTAKAYRWSFEEVEEFMRNALRMAFISHEEKLQIFSRCFVDNSSDTKPKPYMNKA